MKNIKTIFSIFLLLSLLTGCIGSVPFNETEAPNEYYEREVTIESSYGATQEDIIKELGEPEWIEKRDVFTYFIYQSVVYEYGVSFAVLPFPYRSSDEYCLFVKFDEASHLVEHRAIRTEPRPFHDCMDEFYWFYPVSTDG